MSLQIEESVSLRWVLEEELLTQEDGSVKRMIKVSMDENGNTPLHTCAREGNFPGVMELIRSAVHPNLFDMQNYLGRTALHEAVKADQCEIVRALLICGANPHIFDVFGVLPMHLACYDNHLDCLDALVYPIGEEEAELRDELEKSEEFTANSHHGRLEMPTSDGIYCVHIAAEGDHLDILKYLIDNGADVNAVTDDREVTPLHLAIEGRNDDIFYYLIGCPGLNVDPENNHGITPYQFADVLRRPSIRDALKEAGALPATFPAEYSEAYVLGYDEFEEDSDGSDYDVGYRTDVSGVESDYSDLDED